MRLLLGEGIAGEYGKNKKEKAGVMGALGLNQANENVTKFLDGLSSDSDSEEEVGPGGYKRGHREVVYIEEEATPVEVFREKTVEDIIEEQRAKLAESGQVGTPVNAETFAAWRAKKLADRQAAAEARMKAEQTKKKGGKGLCKCRTMLSAIKWSMLSHAIISHFLF